MALIQVNTDGGARGNPGPAAIGVVIVRSDGTPVEKKRVIGHATNNQAEYLALLWAVQLLGEEAQEGDQVDFRLDSELVVKQMRGEYKIKNGDLKTLQEQVQAGLKHAPFSYQFNHVPRAQNKEADRLVNEALDEAK